MFWGRPTAPGRCTLARPLHFFRAPHRSLLPRPAPMQTRGHVIPALAPPDLQRLRTFLEQQQEATAAARQQEAPAVAGGAAARAAVQPGSRL